jgi:CBS domain-containing protein
MCAPVCTPAWRQRQSEAAALMQDKQIWDLPVIDAAEKLVGLIHRHDVN